MRKLLLILIMVAASSANAACLQTPIPGTIITSNFGLRFHPVYHTWKSHNGTDFRAPSLTRIYAAEAGQVTFSGAMGRGGNTVMVLGADGVQTRYLHLTKAGVNIGDMVSAGQPIGLSGNTGEASAAPHLHFEARLGGGSKPVDPKNLLCEKLAEKGGAGPDSTGTPDAPPPVAAPAQPGQQTAYNHEPNFNGYAGMSESEILDAETSKRFLNPEWHMRVGSCDFDGLQKLVDGKEPAKPRDCVLHLRRELSEMQSLDLWMGSKKFELMERIEAMLAVRQALAAKAASKAMLDATRTAAINASQRKK